MAVDESWLKRIQARIDRLRHYHQWGVVEDWDLFSRSIATKIDESKPVYDEIIDASIISEYNTILYELLRKRIERGPASDINIEDKENKAFEEVVNTIRKILNRMTGDFYEEDIVNDVVLYLYQNMDRVRKTGSLTAWITWTVRTFVKKKIREKNDTEDINDTIKDSKDLEGDILSEVDSSEIMRRLKMILTPFQFEIITLNILMGLDPREIAERLGVRVTRVHVEKSRARQRIQSDKAILDYLHEFGG